MAHAKKDVPATDGHPERLIAGATYWSTYELSAEDHEGVTLAPLVMTDGTYGLRKQVASFDCLGLSQSVPATCFPPACLSACTFDPELLRRMGQALGEECLRESVDVLLGPAINVKRHPLCGRNFEYFSEDPLLSGELARAYIAGVQSTGVGACVKHFVGNGQETHRMTSDSVIDDRALHELYLRGFEQVVAEGVEGDEGDSAREDGTVGASAASSSTLGDGIAAGGTINTTRGTEPAGAGDKTTSQLLTAADSDPSTFFGNQPAAIMTAYNRLNGTYCSQNASLLQFARNTWGYKGIFVSDWGAMSQSIPSVAAGLDLCMPGPRLDHSATVRKAVKHGTLPASALAECEAHLTRLMEHAQAIHARTNTAGGADFDEAEHLALAQVIAEQGAVLLKNERVASGRAALPLGDNQHIAIIGAFAKHPRYQGAGSARVNPIALDNTWDALSELAGERGYEFSYAAGYDPTTGDTTSALLDEAFTCAQGADTVVVFVGLPECYESEGVDRSSLALPEGMNDLVAKVCTAGKPVVAVLCGGSVMELPWRDQVSSILLMYLPGCQGGHACANLLTGVVNPSGRLAESWPATVQDTALGSAYPVTTPQVLYAESVFVGYRYYTSAQVKTAYPFGYGLSYTTFALDAGQVSVDGMGNVSALCRVTNTGSCEGAEVVQVYVHVKDATVPRPALALAGFAKVHVKPGESVSVKVDLDEHVFGFWDVDAKQWRLDAGTYEVCIGTSSEALCLRETISLKPGQRMGTLVAQEPSPLLAATRCALAPYFNVVPHGFTQSAFQVLYGKAFPKLPPIRPFTPDSSVRDIQVTPLGRLIAKEIHKHGMDQSAAHDPDTQRMMEAMLDSMPLRNLATGGGSYSLVMALVDALNGKPIKAAGSLFSHPETLIHELEEIPALEKGKL